MTPLARITEQIAALRLAVRAQPTYQRGIVDAIDPLRVRIYDGVEGGTVLPFAPVSLAPLHLGQQVWTMRRGTEWIVLGAITAPASVPWRSVVVTGQAVFSNSAFATTSLALPADVFTVAPKVYPAIETSTGLYTATSSRALSATEAEVRLARIDGSLTTVTLSVSALAVQMTPTSAGG